MRRIAKGRQSKLGDPSHTLQLANKELKVSKCGRAACLASLALLQVCWHCRRARHECLAWAQTLKILLLGVQHGDVWVCVHASLVLRTTVAQFF
jgi:hypothetical protein